MIRLLVVRFISELSAKEARVVLRRPGELFARWCFQRSPNSLLDYETCSLVLQLLCWQK